MWKAARAQEKAVLKEMRDRQSRAERKAAYIASKVLPLFPLNHRTKIICRLIIVCHYA